MPPEHTIPDIYSLEKKKKWRMCICSVDIMPLKTGYASICESVLCVSYPNISQCVQLWDLYTERFSFPVIVLSFSVALCLEVETLLSSFGSLSWCQMPSTLKLG